MERSRLLTAREGLIAANRREYAADYSRLRFPDSDEALRRQGQRQELLAGLSGRVGVTFPP